MRERPNRTVSKTVVGPAHRGFKSHSLRRPGLGLRFEGPGQRARSIGKQGDRWAVVVAEEDGPSDGSRSKPVPHVVEGGIERAGGLMLERQRQLDGTVVVVEIADRHA